MAIQHEDATGIHKFAYVQALDPGAVGAYKGWVDTSNPTPVLKVRNAVNSGWDSLGVLGSSIVGTPANTVGLLQRTRWNLSQASETILTVPAGKNVILNKIVLTALVDTTAEINAYEVWFDSGGQNLTGQLYNRATIFWGDFAKGLGLAGPGYTGGLSARYDPITGFIYDFGILQADLVAETDYPGTIPHDIDIFVFGTVIDNIF
jgi:hypothetical protein